MLDVFSQVVAKSSNPTAVFTSLNDGGYTVRITDASGYTVDEAVVIEAGQVVEVSIALTGGTFYYTTDVIEASVAQPISGMTYECFKKPESASGFIIYQNPTRDILNVQINQKKGFNKLSIFDASGRLIHTEMVNVAQGQQTLQINLNDIAEGLYQINLEGNGKRSTAKFSKTNKLLY